MTIKEHTRFRDIKPYFTPESLDDLQGPYTGEITLAHSVLWIGDGKVDLSQDGGVQLAYQALLAEGTPSDQTDGLNKKRLIEVWPHLMLDPRVAQLWESKFPELPRRAQWTRTKKNNVA